MNGQEHKRETDRKSPVPENEFTALTALGLVGTVGFLVAVPIVGGVVAGALIDRLAGTGGIGLIAGILLGVFAGMYGAYRVIMRETPWKP